MRIYALLFLLLAIVSGCGPDVHELDERELSDPATVRAAALERAGNYEDAIRAYHRILTERPEMARIHLAVAFLHDVPQGDYVRSIYHYHRYLELRPQTEKRAMINERIENARQALVAQYGRDAGTLMTRIETLQEKTREMEAANLRLRTQLEESRARVTKLEDQLAAERERIFRQTIEAIPEHPSPAPIEERRPAMVPSPDPRTPDRTESRQPEPEMTLPDPAEPDVSPERKTAYVVQEGDTLSALARRFYGDRYQWRRIYDANRDRIPNPDILPVGITVLIPDVPPDVVPQPENQQEMRYDQE